MIAGDLFHRQPLMRELKEVNYLFTKISNVKIVLIAGNHDYLKQGSYALGFEWAPNVVPLYGEYLEIAEFPELQTSVYGFSYYQKEITEPRYNAVKSEGKQPIEILLAHGGDDRHIPIQKAALASSGFDYVALGHIHKPQAVIPNRAVYAGALEPIDVNDTGKHGYILGEIAGSQIKTHFVESAVREYKHLSLTINEQTTERKILERIRETIEKLGTEHLYKIIVKGFRDPDMKYDLTHMDPYGNLIAITDESVPAYNFEKLLVQNRDNLLGKYIYGLLGSEDGSVEYEALCEGVQALMETRGEQV